ncbi:MAG: hypothetical protein RL477_584 [Pseudomonadota bacterium]
MAGEDKKYAFAQATVVLFNPQAQMRSILRSAMQGLGFENVLDYGEFDQARFAVIERAPDLVLLDLDSEKDKVCGLVREIRNTNICADPFVPVMVLSWQPNMVVVNNIMEAGVDDMIVMPLSIKMIYERIDALIRNRPEFVVTSSYVGPERRSGGREKIDALGLGTIKVPNSLRFKATGDQAAMASIEAINEVKQKIEHHRVNRYAQRIQWLLDQILSDKAKKIEDSAVTVQRHDEIGRLIEDTSFDLRARGHVELLEITDSMMRLLDFVRARHSKQFYDFLRLHAMAINATLLEREGAAQLVAQALEETASYLDRIEAA